MMIRLFEVNISLDDVFDLAKQKIKVAKLLKTKVENIKVFKIQKRSLDARNKSNIHYKFNYDIEFFNNVNLKHVSHKYQIIEQEQKEKENIIKKTKRVCVVGSGPSGLFCALKLALAGVQVTLLERGEKVEDRIITVQKFLNGGSFNKQSNIQFGEGGAGTFSDGKLNTGIKSKHIEYVLQTFYDCGAKEDILYDSKPHIGTDILREVVKNIRKKLLNLQVKIYFSTFFKNFEVKGEKIEVQYLNENGDKKELFDDLVLAVGYSARETIKMLYDKKINIEQKDFSVGYRIEHLREDINKSQFGENFKHKNLSAADYKLFTHLDNGRTVYTFCMCPGGEVVPAISDDKEICVNGMSLNARNSYNSNSAVLVNVTKKDYNSIHPLAGMYYQQQLEKNAFEKGQGKFICSRFEDFAKNKASQSLGKVNPSIKPNYILGNVYELLPQELAESIKQGIINFGQKLKGFDDKDAVLTGIETRSSAPFTIVRYKNNQTSIEHVYAIGEGAGQAGGIMSSAVDGIKIAESIIKKYCEE